MSNKSGNFDSDSPYLFEVLDMEVEYPKDNPLFAFFKRSSNGDELVFARPSPSGLLWTSDPSVDHFGIGRIEHPTNRFFQMLARVVGKKQVRDIINSDGEPHQANLVDVSLDSIRDSPPYEHYLVKLVIVLLDDGYPLTPELREFLQYVESSDLSQDSENGA